jgi:hypothetical protein
MVPGFDQLGTLRLDESTPCGTISIYNIDPELRPTFHWQEQEQ